MSSKKSFFSIPPASVGGQGSQVSTPRRNSSAANLRRGSGSAAKPGWQGVYESESAPTSRRTSFSEDSGELGAKTPPLTPPLMKLTRVKVEDRVKVIVRLRPAQSHETPGAVQVAEDGQHVLLERTKATIPTTEFKFDEVLRQRSTQGDVYAAAVEPVVADVLNGYNGTVMAYGQTGAGKTFTLSSLAPDNIGMMPRAAAAIFNGIKADLAHHYTVHMSYMQIYMEMTQDLLQPKSMDLQLRESPEEGVYVAGLKEVLLTRLEDCLELLKLGERNRMYAFTKLNAHSSRSHALVLLTVAKRRVIAGAGPTPSADNVSMKANVGRLYMVDLAGSERLKKSMSTGIRASEAKAINLSLTVLGMCINARASANASHAPYRDSKLTRILKESLGGNARTSLVVAVADAIEHCDETLQSLQFGTRAMFVENSAVVNEKTDDAVTHQQLLLEMEEQAGRAEALSRSLIDKESALGNLERKLEDERKANEDIMQALDQERQQALAAQQRAMERHLAELEAERKHQADLAAQLSQTQAHSEQLASRHKQEQAKLMADLEARTAALTATQATVAEREAAHASLQQHCKDLQERLRVELEGASNRSAAEVAELESQLEQAAHELAAVNAAAATAAEKAAAELSDMQQRLVAETNAALAELQATRKAAAAELDRVRAGAADSASAAEAELRTAKEAAAAELNRVRAEAADSRSAAAADLQSAKDASAADLQRVRQEAEVQLADAKREAQDVHATLRQEHQTALERMRAEHEAEVEQLAEQIIQLDARLQQATADAQQHASSATALQEQLEQQDDEAKAAAAQAEEEFEALRSAADAEAQELHRQLDQVLRGADAAAATAAEEAEQLRLEARQAAADHRAQVDQLLKEAELLRNEAELACAEHENRLADAQSAAQRDKAAAEQREAALQNAKDEAEQQHRAVASHLQETVRSLEAKLQAQRELIDSHAESHAREVADLKSQLEQAQAVEDAMAAEMADLRAMVGEAEAERDEAAEEVGRLGAELDRLQQEWASDSAEFKARWTAREADAEAARRRAAEAHSRELARRDAEIADATANSRVAAAAAAKALNEATAKAASYEAEVGRLQATAEQQAAALAAAQEQAAQVAEYAEQRTAALTAAEASRTHIAGALKALTGQHIRTCTEGSRAKEELEQLTGAYDQLSEQVEDLSAEQQRLQGECAALLVQLSDETQGRQQDFAAAAAAAAAAAEQAAKLRARNERLAEQNAQLEAALRAHKSSAAVAEERAAAEQAEAAAREQEAAAKTAVREAALVVQRRYRARRAQQQASDLANRQKALEEARREKAALEARAAEHAAATGRKDFAASLGMMQEAVDTLLGAFLLPSRELRAQRARRQRPPGFNLGGSAVGTAVAPSGSSHGGSSVGAHSTASGVSNLMQPAPLRPASAQHARSRSSTSQPAPHHGPQYAGNASNAQQQALGRVRRLTLPRTPSAALSEPSSPHAPGSPADGVPSPASSMSSFRSFNVGSFPDAVAALPALSSPHVPIGDAPDRLPLSDQFKPLPPPTHLRWADPEADPRLSLRDIVNLPGGNESPRRSFSAHSPDAAVPGFPLKAAGSPLRPGTARSTTGREGGSSSASTGGGGRQYHSRGRSGDHSPRPDSPELGGFAAIGANSAVSTTAGAGKLDRSKVGQSFTFTAMGEQLRSPTMLPGPLSPADADDSRLTAGPHGSAVPTSARAATSMPVGWAADGGKQAAHGNLEGADEAESLRALPTRPPQQPAQGQWARRPQLTVHVPPQ